MRVLVVSQYYRPEVGATQNRLGTFADGLTAMGHRVTVICEQPNHPAGIFQPGYGRRPLKTGRDSSATVHRLWVAASPKKSTARRLAFYGTFAAGAGSVVAALAGDHDVVFASSPPLPGVLTAAVAARARRTPIVVDVRDIWPAAAEALGELSNPKVLRAFERAERWLYRTAARVTTTTRPFCRHINNVAGREVSVHIPNGALDSLVHLPAVAPPSNGQFTVGYAGNIGLAQGLNIVLDAADRLRDESVRFVLVGAGPLEAEMRDEIARRDLRKVVQMRPPVPVDSIGNFLVDCHALLIPLRAHGLLGDFIPSKLYDAMAVGRPALVAAPGEATALALDMGCGLAVRPEDGDDLADKIRRLRDEPGLAVGLGAAGKAAAASMSRSRQVDVLERVLAEAAGAD